MVIIIIMEFMLNNSWEEVIEFIGLQFMFSEFIHLYLMVIEFMV